MSGQASQNVLRVDPRAFDQDYEYGRAVQYGLWVPGYILGANVHTKRGSNSKTLKVIVGVMSTEPNPTTGKKCGAKIDTYVPLAGDRYKRAVECGDPESPKRYAQAIAQGIPHEKALVAAETNLDKWAGKPIMVLLGEEDDKLQSERTGVPSKRARVEDMMPHAPAAAPAPAPIRAGASLI